MISPSSLKHYQHEFMLAGIILVSGLLYLVNLGQNGFANTYYAAAVQSILASPGQMIWGSFDSAGFVTVDKPPAGLWVQTVSALIFGYTGWALILPQALAGIGSVILLYVIVSRSWGKTTGLIAAAVLSITPMAVAVGRTNNLDGLLVLVLLLAFITALKAWREGSLPWLFATAVLVGIGFNIKMIQAFAVVPAFFGIYILSKQIPLKKRIINLFCAGAVLLVISFSWAVMVDLTPADQRPYIGSSEGNSALELIFGYNGISRIIGNGGMPGDGPGGLNRTMGQDRPGMPGGRQNQGATPLMNSTGGTGPVLDLYGMQGRPGDQNAPPGGVPSPGLGGMNEGGSPGLFRLGNEQMAGQISWLIPFALIGTLLWFRRPSLSGLMNLSEQDILVVSLFLWLIPELAYFSLATGHFHRYYLVMVGPPLAALAGIGLVGMYREYLGTLPRKWLLVLAIPVTGALQTIFLLYTPEFSGVLPWVTGSGSLIIGGILAAFLLCRRNIRTTTVTGIIGLGFILLCIAPALWSCTPLFLPSNGQIPSAGPDQEMGGGPGGNQMPGNTDYSSLITYLTSHRTSEKYLVGVQSAMSGGSEIIINSGEAVMAIGGFTGSDPIVTDEKLKEMTRNGEIRYFFVSQRGESGGPSSEEITSWIPDSCEVVSEDEWSNQTITRERGRAGNVLYDCHNTRE